MARNYGPYVAAGVPIVLVVGGMLACVGVCAGFPCLTTGARYGVWADQCPASDLRLDVDVSAYGLLREQDGGTIEIVPRARWLEGDGLGSLRTEVLRRGYSWDVTLLDAAGNEVD